MSKDNKHQHNAAGKQTEPENHPEVMDNVDEAVEEELEDVKDAAAQQLNEIDTLRQQLADEQAKVEKEKKEYLFLMAEFDNFRKRTMKEKSEIIKNSTETAMKGILPILDDFERGIEANKASDDPSAIRQGMELIYNKFVKYLESNGVKPIESTGAAFDPDLHEAIAMVPGDDASKGKVIDTLTKGYKINDKVLRHAKVAVGQ